ncbi:hypothetical protein CYMTET_47563 [Cymbomonas tetramitiformis]|uniref:Uncharacterized protein n=1 Tax=Cymbomonas tetramitiformis TaxID=36881 RepID=A0AAE0BVY1_9CHLO|nr:hypothetical protein CYMTET_47563 [Cymbomonas tetramitiformis]
MDFATSTGLPAAHLPRALAAHRGEYSSVLLPTARRHDSGDVGPVFPGQGRRGNALRGASAGGVNRSVLRESSVSDGVRGNSARSLASHVTGGRIDHLESSVADCLHRSMQQLIRLATPSPAGGGGDSVCFYITSGTSSCQSVSPYPEQLPKRQFATIDAVRASAAATAQLHPSSVPTGDPAEERPGVGHNSCTAEAQSPQPGEVLNGCAAEALPPQRGVGHNSCTTEAQSPQSGEVLNGCATEALPPQPGVGYNNCTADAQSPQPGEASSSGSEPPMERVPPFASCMNSLQPLQPRTLPLSYVPEVEEVDELQQPTASLPQLRQQPATAPPTQTTNLKRGGELVQGSEAQPEEAANKQAELQEQSTAASMRTAA